MFGSGTINHFEKIISQTANLRSLWSFLSELSQRPLLDGILLIIIKYMVNIIADCCGVCGRAGARVGP